jgi:hypothetical protein
MKVLLIKNSYEQEHCPFGLRINKKFELLFGKKSNPNECVQIQHKHVHVQY